MNNGLLRCIVLIVFSIFQVQVIASETNYIYKNDIASKFNFKEVFFLNNFFSSKVSESIFFAEQEIFSIRAEVDNNGCFTGNSNNIAVRFIIKNITNVNQVIEGRTAELGNKLQLVSSSGVSVNGFSGSSNLLTNARTLAPGEEFVIDGTFSMPCNAIFISFLFIEVMASIWKNRPGKLQISPVPTNKWEFLLIWFIPKCADIRLKQPAFIIEAFGTYSARLSSLPDNKFSG